jgi:hypothetical protein
LGCLHKNEEYLKTLIFIFLNPLSITLDSILIPTHSNHVLNEVLIVSRYLETQKEMVWKSLEKKLEVIYLLESLKLSFFLNF